MTKHTLTPDSITAAKAMVCRLCENGHVRMSVPVDFARDDDMLICALIEVAEKSLVTPAASRAADDGYATAFYEIASVLGIGARADTPENVFRNEMLPKIIALAAPMQAPAAADDARDALKAITAPGESRAMTDREDDLAHEAEMKARAVWRESADLDDIELDELDEPDKEECSRCRGDGRDPWNDYLLPCPECQGEQRP